jgi:hypothetical protein
MTDCVHLFLHKCFTANVHALLSYIPARYKSLFKVVLHKAVPTCHPTKAVHT